MAQKTEMQSMVALTSALIGAGFTQLAQEVDDGKSDKDTLVILTDLHEILDLMILGVTAEIQINATQPVVQVVDATALMEWFDKFAPVQF